MYTTFDKAIVALVMAVIGIIGVVWKPINIDPTLVATIVGIATPLLVYLWPNLPKDS